MNDVNSFLYIHGPDLIEGVPYIAGFVVLYALLNYAAIMTYRHFTA